MPLKILPNPSPNWDERPPGGAITHVILHYTGMETARAALQRLCSPAAKVSAHYIIGRGGAVWRLVDESKRAWHAGRSFWRGATSLNDCSIGIELVNRGHKWGYQKYPPKQAASCIDLLRDIMRRHGIPRENILGHSDIAPDRKTDPGEFFPWKKLAGEGIGVWPEPVLTVSHAPASRAEICALLSCIGYDCPQGASDETLRHCLLAFQRHWLPDNLTGICDAATLARLRACVR